MLVNYHLSQGLEGKHLKKDEFISKNFWMAKRLITNVFSRGNNHSIVKLAHNN